MSSSQANEINRLYEPEYHANWELATLYDLAEWKNGLAFKNICFSDSGKPIIKIAELKNGITEQTKFTKDNFDESVYLTKGDMVFSWSGNPETSIDVFWYDLPEGWLNQHIFKISVKDKVDRGFFFYILKYLKPNFTAIATNKQTTGLGHVTIGDLKNMKVRLPLLTEQNSIAKTLSCLDNKIELNNQITKSLEEIAQAVYKSWFVDFESFQDSEFEDSELGMIPKDWKVGVLDDVIELFDSKRIPLSSRKRDAMKKIYPYYGATSLMDYVDDYIFDGLYVLLGEDGTVVNSDGYPILQYVWGKFWVNNHAHILKGKNGFNEDSLFMLLKNTNVQSIVTGAVQLKINQANLKSVKVIIPDQNTLANYNNIIEPIFSEKRRIFEENQTLTNIRDSLLPKLMSGEIRIPIEEV